MSEAIGVVFVLFLICAGIFVYFYPTLQARSVEHPDSTPIFVLNLLLGWMLIPWVVALVWAFKGNHKKREQAASAQTRRPDLSTDTFGNAQPVPPRVLGQPLPPDKPSTKVCPFCAEDVKYEAIKCKHCRSDLTAAT
jgi:hypothetical protein